MKRVIHAMDCIRMKRCIEHDGRVPAPMRSTGRHGYLIPAVDTIPAEKAAREALGGPWR